MPSNVYFLENYIASITKFHIFIEVYSFTNIELIKSIIIYMKRNKNR